MFGMFGFCQCNGAVGRCKDERFSFDGFRSIFRGRVTQMKAVDTFRAAFATEQGGSREEVADDLHRLVNRRDGDDLLCSGFHRIADGRRGAEHIDYDDGLLAKIEFV